MTQFQPIESTGPSAREIDQFRREIALNHFEALEHTECTGRNGDVAARLAEIHQIAGAASKSLQRGDPLSAALELSAARDRFQTIPPIFA